MRTEDGRVIYKCLNGEPEAFGLLVDKYRAGIYAFVYAKLGNFHDAQDVAQEVFVEAYRNLSNLRRWESFVFWLYRIASACCAKWIRTRSRRPDREFIADQNPKHIASSSINSYRNNQMDESLREGLASLSDEYREVLTLRYFAGMRSKDIAKALGTSPDAIRKRLSRARLQLKEEMIAMMGTAFDEQKLQASFTFRIVEMIKRIRIKPMPRITSLPWGLSVTTGIMLILLRFGSYPVTINSISAAISPPLPDETAVMDTWEIAIDLLKIEQLPYIASASGNGAGNLLGIPAQQNAVLMSSMGEGGEFPQEPSARLGKGSANGIAYSPDGKVLAVAGGTGIWLYDADSLTEIAHLQGNYYSHIAFNPDGKLMALNSSREKEIHLWDVNEQKQIGTLKNKDYIYAIAFSPGGKLLALGDYGKVVRLWDVQSQKQIGMLQGHTEWVSSVAFSLDGKTLASGSGDKTIRLWDVQSQKQIGILQGHTEWVSSIAFSPDGKILVSGGGDKTVRRWDIGEQKQTGLIKGFTDWIGSIAFSPDGKTLASLDGYHVMRLWDVDKQIQKGPIEGFNDEVYSLAFSPDGKTLVSGCYPRLSLWDVREQKQVGSLEGHQTWGGAATIAFSPDGGTIASANFNDIYLFDAKDQEQIGTLKGHTGEVRSIAFSPDGKTLVSGSMDYTVRIWDVGKQNEIKMLRNSSHAHCVAISPDGETVAAAIGGENLVRLWDADTKNGIGVLRDPARAVITVSFSPDGKTLASGSYGNMIYLWDYRKQVIIGQLVGHTSFAYPYFSPDGRWIASAGTDGTARIWDVEEQKQIFMIEGHSSASAVAFSPDGKWLASGGYEGTIQLWEVDIPVEWKSVEPTGKLIGTWGKVKQTKLLQNYPNPFNPETWIPYQLSSATDVKITIHNSSGHLIRTLDIGHKPAGSYITRESSAYWDGRNETGEQVASGVYFYSMEAGDYSSTRKMIILR